MSEDPRIDRLEARVAALEGLVREMTGRAPSGRVGSGEAGKEPAAGATPISALLAQTPTAPQGVRPPPPPASPPPRFPASPLSSEQWIGQRVLLAVGVTALILAAGYLLRL